MLSGDGRGIRQVLRQPDEQKISAHHLAKRGVHRAESVQGHDRDEQLAGHCRGRGDEPARSGRCGNSDGSERADQAAAVRHLLGEQAIDPIREKFRQKRRAVQPADYAQHIRHLLQQRRVRHIGRAVSEGRNDLGRLCGAGGEAYRAEGRHPVSRAAARRV